jgi:hypothetical protein
MSCMCGDCCCPSCGYAQGNFKCPVCRTWASDGCEHIDEESGDLKPEFQTQQRFNELMAFVLGPRPED